MALPGRLRDREEGQGWRGEEVDSVERKEENVSPDTKSGFLLHF